MKTLSSFFCLMSCSERVCVMFASAPLLLPSVLLFPHDDVYCLCWLCAVFPDGFIIASVWCPYLISLDRCLMMPSLFVVKVSPSPIVQSGEENFVKVSPSPKEQDQPADSAES